MHITSRQRSRRGEVNQKKSPSVSNPHTQAECLLHMGAQVVWVKKKKWEGVPKIIKKKASNRRVCACKAWNCAALRTQLAPRRVSRPTGGESLG